MISIPFVKIHLTGKEYDYISKATTLHGDGTFTQQCHALMQKLFNCQKALLTHSCTAALEMTALLLDIQPGDEIIMPSYTFVSTANAFVLRGGVPHFVDIRNDTLNLDETKIESAITAKTKAIVPVHYAGVACEMDTILQIAKKHHLYVIEDAAQGVMAKYKNQFLGTLGHFGTYSFHDTKNIISGEGGALLINHETYNELAEIIREKGTDRSHSRRQQIDQYTWQHVGSSFLPSELIAAFLLAQLEQAESITARRLKLWDMYHAAFADLETADLIRRPIIPEGCEHNGHMYYILLPHAEKRMQLLNMLKTRGISSVAHYVPLHNSPAGKKYGKFQGILAETESLSERLLRLPLFVDMDESIIFRVVDAIKAVI